MNKRNQSIFTIRPLKLLIFLYLITIGNSCIAAEESTLKNTYLLQPGDILQISVWKEDDLDKAVIIRPDGRINFPLVGEAQAAGNSVENLRKLISAKLTKYIPDPVVSVSVQQLSGNIVYVIGKVNKPGQFAVTRNIDVMQALSMAGGTAIYAALNKIKILRRDKQGALRAIPFEYGDVSKGKHLEQNIILQAGDVVVVP